MGFPTSHQVVLETFSCGFNGTLHGVEIQSRDDSMMFLLLRWDDAEVRVCSARCLIKSDAAEA